MPGTYHGSFIPEKTGIQVFRVWPADAEAYENHTGQIYPYNGDVYVV